MAKAPEAAGAPDRDERARTMTVKRMRWAAALAAALGLPGLAAAQGVVWRAVAGTPEKPAVVASTVARPASGGVDPRRACPGGSAAPAIATACSPAACLGRPVALTPNVAQAVPPAGCAPRAVAGRPVP